MDNLVSLLSNHEKNTEIVDYAVKNIDRLISDWSYAANTSNHGQYGTYTIALATVLETPEYPEQHAIAVCRKIIDNELKTIYRALTMIKPAQTVPTITLLTQMVQYCSTELFNNFDFTLGVIRRLLSLQPFRNSFLKFYIALIQKSPGPNRRELISNRKIISVWFGKLGLEDSEDQVILTLETLNKYILKDVTNFTKTAKMGIFNDWTLKNLVRILATPEISTALVEELSKFLLVLLCDKTYGVRMASGEQRLVLSFLKIIKPWETVAQMDLVIRLLKEMPELIAPYFDQLSQVYTLTPKATMWWVSYTVLHIRVLKLDGAAKSVECMLKPNTALLTNHTLAPPPPSPATISKSVIPVTVTKAALQQALQSETAFVRFQAAQIVLFALRRLHTVVNRVYKPRNWDPSPLIEEILQTRFPDISVFTKDCEPALLKTTFYVVLREWGQLKPLNSVAIGMNLAAKAVKGLELVQVENLLEIQTYTGDQTKWWNPSKDALSLFTQLLKFATYNFQLADKSGQLLQHLVQPTQLFADIPTLTHPVDALLFTLSTCHSDLTWQVVEQAIQRAIKSPYQYIDKVQSDQVSPFIVALTEQYSSHFAEKDTDKVTEKWIKLFARSLIVLGESKDAINKLLLPLTGVERTIGQDEYFNFVLDAPDKSILQRQDLVFKISNKLEVAATIYRAVNTTNDKVRNHLLASIPADVLPLLATEPAAFMPFIKGSKSLLQAFLVTIDVNDSLQLSRALESCENWELGIPRLSTEFLLNKFTETHNISVLSELNNRQVLLPIELIPSVLNVDGLAENLKLRAPHSIPPNEGEFLLKQITKNEMLAAELVKLSGVYPPDHPLANTALVLVAAAIYANEQLDSGLAIRTACGLLRQGQSSGLKVIVSLHTEISSEVWEAISDFVEKSKSSGSVLHGELVTLGKLEPPYLSRWLKIVVHQLTKRFSEGKMNPDQYEFLQKFNHETLAEDGSNIWQYVSHNALNGLIEAIMLHDHNTQSLDLVTRIAMQSASAASATKLQSLAHVSTLMERPLSKESDMLSEVLALYSLITVNLEACSTLSVEQGLLVRYNGSLDVKDRLILSLLEQIESVRQRSWVDSVESWDVRPVNNNVVDEYDRDPLIMIKGGSSIFVTLDEQRIRHTIQHFECPLDLEIHRGPQSIEKYRLVAPNDADVLYDSEFLLNLVVSCNYLFENMEVFLTSGLLSFVLCCLSSAKLEDTAVSILKHVFKQLEDMTFKDKVTMRILIGKVLMFHQQQNEQPEQKLPSHIPVISGQIALVLSKPSHFLYSAASKWLLSSPSIQHFDIPLCKAIISSQSDFKLREMIWLVNSLKSGAVDESAVQSYIKSGVIEWCLSQYQLLNTKTQALKEAIKQLLDRIEEVKGGSIAIITTSGGLSIPDIKQRLFYSAGSAVQQYVK